MTKDRFVSFNVVNINSQTAGLGFSLVCGILCMYLGYKGYRHFCLEPCSPREKARRELPAPLPAVSLDMPDMREGIRYWECQPRSIYPDMQHFHGKAFPAHLDYFPSQALPPMVGRGRMAVPQSSPRRRPRSEESTAAQRAVYGGGKNRSPSLF